MLAMLSDLQSAPSTGKGTQNTPSAQVYALIGLRLANVASTVTLVITASLLLGLPGSATGWVIAGMVVVIAFLNILGGVKVILEQPL